MQAPTSSPGTNFSTQSMVTKSQEQILIQSSGAMVAVIVLGVIIILAVLLLILKTYNRHTQVSRMLGTSGGSKSRQKTSTAVTQERSVAMRNLGTDSISGRVDGRSGSVPSVSGNSFHASAVWLSDTQHNDLELFSTDSGSTVVTIHDPLPLENT